MPPLFSAMLTMEDITYRIRERKGQWTITCLVCGMTSYNENDVKYQYCGKCSQFHDILALEDRGQVSTLRDTISESDEIHG